MWPAATGVVLLEELKWSWIKKVIGPLVEMGREAWSRGEEGRSHVEPSNCPRVTGNQSNWGQPPCDREFLPSSCSHTPSNGVLSVLWTPFSLLIYFLHWPQSPSWSFYWAHLLHSWRQKVTSFSGILSKLTPGKEKILQAAKQKPDQEGPLGWE